MIVMTIGYIGSYTKHNGKGIYRYELDDVQGRIKFLETGYNIEASTYLAQTDDYLYAITKEDAQCGVASFKKEADGSLTYMNQCLPSTEGTGCYISISTSGEYLFEAVYSAGLVRLYKLDTQTGHIINLIDELALHYPLGSHERQEHSHAHFIHETPDQRFVVVTDLGADRIITYEFSDKGFKESAVSQFNDADGPRHIAYHNNGQYAYVVHELSNIISVTTYQNGEFHELERHSTIPEQLQNETKLAAVRLSHDQRFIYVSNRGDDSIAIFKLSDEGAHLELIDIVKSGGVFPRDFNITASDDYIVCAHQEDGGIVTVFERNHDTGKLLLTDSTHVAPEGVCVTFLN